MVTLALSPYVVTERDVSPYLVITHLERYTEKPTFVWVWLVSQYKVMLLEKLCLIWWQWGCQHIYIYSICYLLNLFLRINVTDKKFCLIRNRTDDLTSNWQVCLMVEHLPPMGLYCWRSYIHTLTRIERGGGVYHATTSPPLYSTSIHVVLKGFLSF